MSANNHKTLNERLNHRMNDKRRRASYSGRHPDLRSGTPVSLRAVKPAHLFFNEAVDPLLKKQHEALRKAEAQRREDNGGGSQMVKLHKPFPELKPKYELKPIRDKFNRNLLQERRDFALKYLKSQNDKNNTVEENSVERTRSRERTPSR